MVKPLPTVPKSFRGAIALSNWLKRNNYFLDPTGPVNVSEGGVWPAFKTAVQESCKKTIHRHFRPTQNFISISFFSPSSNAFHILIPKPFNRCHRRFAVCKELCHILTDKHSAGVQHRGNPVEQIANALLTANHVRSAGGYPGSSPLFTTRSIGSEDFCFLLAVEILLPIRERTTILENSVNGMSSYDIAFRLVIPESLVKFYIISGYHVAYKRNDGFNLMPDKLGDD